MTEMPNGFENETFQSVVESALYTDDGMFGEIRWCAQQELFKRLKLLFPEPEWSRKHTSKTKTEEELHEERDPRQEA